MKNLTKLLSLATLTCSFTLLTINTSAQNVGVNGTGATADPSAMLDVVASDKGALLPRIALTGTTDVATISSPATSLLIYNTATISDVTPGYYYYNGSAWVQLIDANGIKWNDGASNSINYTAGNLGLGTTSPTEKLEINGSIYLSDTIKTGILSATSGITSSDPYNFGSNGWLDFHSPAGFAFVLNNDNGPLNALDNFEVFNADYTTSLFRIQNGGNVGVGTATPSEKLEVVGNLELSGGATQLKFSGGAGLIRTMSGGSGAGDITFNVWDGSAATNALHIEETGNVGVGTTTPNAPLHIESATPSLQIGSNATFSAGKSAKLNLKGYYGYSDVELSSAVSAEPASNLSGIYSTYGASINPAYPFSGYGNLVLYARDNLAGGDIVFRNGNAGTGRSTQMVVKNTGNVGIGTTAPARKLHVSDAMRLEPIATAPSSPSAGDMYFSSTTNKLMVYDGSVWQACW